MKKKLGFWVASLLVGQMAIAQSNTAAQSEAAIYGVLDIRSVYIHLDMKPLINEAQVGD